VNKKYISIVYSHLYNLYSNNLCSQLLLQTPNCLALFFFCTPLIYALHSRLSTIYAHRYEAIVNHFFLAKRLIAIGACVQSLRRHFVAYIITIYLVSILLRDGYLVLMHLVIMHLVVMHLALMHLVIDTVIINPVIDFLLSPNNHLIQNTKRLVSHVTKHCS